MFNPKKILVTTDFTKESAHALRVALDIAAKFKSEVHMLHVVDDITQCVADYCLLQEHVEDATRNIMDNVKKKMKEEIKNAGAGAKVKEVIRIGNHIEEIINEADEKKIDLIVVAPHEKHKVWHVLISHLTEELVKKAKCKILLVKE
jgi:nucleotide-binding universal stress UspA family protein